MQVKDAFNTTAVRLDGRSGNVTNLFSNDQNEGNGLVKAWAQINADGTIFACWRCNKDPNETRRLGAGTYEVDFTPLSTDIFARPRSATVNGVSGTEAAFAAVLLEHRVGDSSSVFVGTVHVDARLVDSLFVLIIY